VTLSRRTILRIGRVFLAGLLLPSLVAADDALEIHMMGDATGADVWFEPNGLLVPPGATVRWRNLDRGNSHTTTAYHPDNRGHPLRIPPGAKPWNSDYLLPGEFFAVTFIVPGVYDFFCIPHEMAGMVGRIVVMEKGAAAPAAPADDPKSMGHFPKVEDIIRLGETHRS
jgi:plastocyanin